MNCNSDRPLPAGWTEHTNQDGKSYYCHKETKKTQWNRPTELDALATTTTTTPAHSTRRKTIKAAASLNWKEYKDDSGRTYYYNAKMQKTQWERPAEMDEQTH